MISVPYAVKKALRDGMLRKNYRFLVLNDDGTTDFTIENENLVSESVNFDERLCSSDTIKFGLCEGSSLEFQYFGLDNILDRRLKCFVDVQYGPSDWYSIPMGFFTVQKVSRQASTGILKVLAYNKLMSKSLDADATELVQETITAGEPLKNTVSLFYLAHTLSSDFDINSYPEDVSELFPTETWSIMSSTIPARNSEGQAAPNPWNVWSMRMSLRPSVNYSAADYTSLLFFLEAVGNLCYSKFESAYSSVWGYTETSSYPWTIIPLYDYTCSSSNGGFVSATYGTNTSVTEYIQKCHRDGIKNLKIDYRTSLKSDSYAIEIRVPMRVFMGPQSTPTDEEKAEIYQDFMTFYNSLPAEKLGTFAKKILTNIAKYEIPKTTIIPKVTLRQLQSALFEIDCQFGQLSRESDLFIGVELNHGGLYPADTLYPSDTLYPGGASVSGSKSMYSKLWADEDNVHKWRNLIVTYKTLDGENKEIKQTYTVQVNADGTEDYVMDNNWLFVSLVWDPNDVEAFVDAMVSKMQQLTWFPFEMWCAGLPYLETGDEIEIPLNGRVYTSYVLQRQLKGIQNLQDTYINGTLDIF